MNFLHYEAVCCRMYDIQNGIAPKNTLDPYQQQTYLPHAINYTSDAFCIKQSRLEIQKKNAFSRVGAKVWNGIPVSVRNLKKKKFKQTLLWILGAKRCKNRSQQLQTHICNTYSLEDI